MNQHGDSRCGKAEWHCTVACCSTDQCLLCRLCSRSWRSSGCQLTDERHVCCTAGYQRRYQCSADSWTANQPWCNTWGKLPLRFNPLTPTVAIWVQLWSILCQTGLSQHFLFLTSWHSDAQGWASECLDVKNYKWPGLALVNCKTVLLSSNAGRWLWIGTRVICIVIGWFFAVVVNWGAGHWALSLFEPEPTFLEHAVWCIW